MSNNKFGGGGSGQGSRNGKSGYLHGRPRVSSDLSGAEINRMRGASVILQELEQEEERLRRLAQAVPSTVITSSVAPRQHQSDNRYASVYQLNKPLTLAPIIKFASEGMGLVKKVDSLYFVFLRECDVNQKGIGAPRLSRAKVLMTRNEKLGTVSLFKFTFFKHPTTLLYIVGYAFSLIEDAFKIRRPKLLDFIKASDRCSEELRISREKFMKNVYQNLHIVMATIDLEQDPVGGFTFGAAKHEETFMFVELGELLKGNVPLGENGKIVVRELNTLFG